MIATQVQVEAYFQFVRMDSKLAETPKPSHRATWTQFTVNPVHAGYPCAIVRDLGYDVDLICRMADWGDPLYCHNADCGILLPPEDEYVSEQRMDEDPYVGFCAACAATGEDMCVTCNRLMSGGKCIRPPVYLMYGVPMGEVD